MSKFNKWMIIGSLIIITIIIFYFVFREIDFGNSLPNNFPKDIPIVEGKIGSCKTARSDDLVRVVEVKIQTELSFKDTVLFYKTEFANNSTKELDYPSFSMANSNATKTSSVAMYGKNTVGVFIQAKEQITEVLIQVKGESIFRLPQ